jgi:hypothetical protein
MIKPDPWMRRLTGLLVSQLLSLWVSALFAEPAPESTDPSPGDRSVLADTTNSEPGIVLVFEADSLNSPRDSLLAEDVHPQDTPERRGFFIVADDGQAQLRILGSIRLYGAYDMNGLQRRDFFEIYEIPVGDANNTEPRFFMTASQTRFGLEATLAEAFLRMEGDFRGFPDFSNFRIRHAYAAYGMILAGHTWSVFSDVSAVPLTVEGEGPPNSATERTVQARLRGELFSGRASWAAAVESPGVDISVPDSLQLEQTYQSFPDFTARIRKPGDWGHLQLAGLGRSITIREQSGDLNYLAGWGFLGSGVVRFNASNEFLFELAGGRGIARYIAGFTGRGLDAVWNPTSQQFQTVPIAGGSASLSRDWSPRLYSYLTLGVTKIQNRDYEPGSAYSNGQYLAVSLFYERVAGRRVGFEYNWGRRENKDGQIGTANRISFSLVYDF